MNVAIAENAIATVLVLFFVEKGGKGEYNEFDK